MKYSKLIVGIVIVIVAFWIIVREQMSGASANAFINAPVITVRAPIAGDLQIRSRPLGGQVTNDVVLASIQDPLVDRIRLDDLIMEARFETATLIKLRELLEQTNALRDDLMERAQIFRLHRIEEMQVKLSHAQARLSILERDFGYVEGLEDITDENQRLLDAVEQDIERLPAEPRLQALVLNHARERVATLQITLEAAQQGVFLGDGYNDSPNSEQRVAELDSEIAQLTHEITEREERLASVRERIDSERRTVNRLTGREIRASATGILWEILQADGMNVQRGDPLLRLVDCEALIVTLSVTERIYNRLAIGQPAKFRLGGSSTVLDGTITRLAGSGAATIYENLAVAPSERHLERFDVTLSVPELHNTENLSCPIGRTGRVFFETRPLDWLRSLLN